MWHEARRREKATQKIFSDHRKRAEKRREENRVEPGSLLQVHGVKSRIHLDSNTHKQAAKSLVVWQGDQATTIDRFDVRATLNSLPKEDVVGKKRSTVVDANESETMGKILNYERYRLLIHNDLNQVPEMTRLKLVSKSEFTSNEAKKRKLENNWFGTSGETTLPQQHKGRFNQQQQTRSQGVSIGYNYNQSEQSTAADTTATIGETLLKTVIDLDDNDLDHVEKSARNSKQTEDVTLKYGLADDEFHLMLAHDQSSDQKSLVELQHRLKRLRSAPKKQSPIKSDAAFYGPALPPEMLEGSSNNDISKFKDESSSGGSSPIQQRSPSGSSIPLRILPENRIKVATSEEAANNENRVEEVKEVVVVPDNPPPRHIEANCDKEPSNEVRNERAATPLAYKRYRRSSRSLSRERRGRHRRRSRSRSRATSRSTSPSSSSDSSRSSRSSTTSSSSSSSSSGSSSASRSSRSGTSERRSRSPGNKRHQRHHHSSGRRRR